MNPRTDADELNNSLIFLENTMNRTRRIMSLKALAGLNDIEVDLPLAIRNTQFALRRHGKDAPKDIIQRGQQLINEAQNLEENFQQFIMDSAKKIESILNIIEEVKNVSEEEAVSILLKNPISKEIIEDDTIDDAAIESDQSISDPQFNKKFNQAKKDCYELLQELGLSATNKQPLKHCVVEVKSGEKVQCSRRLE